jgi:hypothetical protein
MSTFTKNFCQCFHKSVQLFQEIARNFQKFRQSFIEISSLNILTTFSWVLDDDLCTVEYMGGALYTIRVGGSYLNTVTVRVMYIRLRLG